ncbi:hypothetical protein DL98DRAFT_588008 [Cadophora sp. DSE1049]|nr:hypothetical protein DL98DRAFT_588008 [Cadophora sp. DSE1049]
MAANSSSSLTPTNTPALITSSTLHSSQNTTPSSTSSLIDKSNNVPLRMNEYFQSSTIKIDIGPEREYWNIPRALLIAKVPYLQPILQPSSAEKDTAGIVMHKEEPATFAHVVDWMLTGEIGIHQRHHEDEAELFLPLLALHAFALRWKM